jgi:hypothetical protein
MITGRWCVGPRLLSRIFLGYGGKDAEFVTDPVHRAYDLITLQQQSRLHRLKNEGTDS